MLEVIDLACMRGERTLFRGVSFTLAARGLLHVAGANGSGKTSLLRIVCGLGLADSGEVRWGGEATRTLREAYWREVLYLGHAHALKDDLTATENLQVANALAGRPVTRAAARDPGRELPTGGIDVAEHRTQAVAQNREPGRGEGERRQQHLGAGRKIHGSNREFERCRTAGEGRATYRRIGYCLRIRHRPLLRKGSLQFLEQRSPV